ncbi:MAG TPA: ATP-dependent DNA ligase [Planctomycetota bacterium]|nr:ATP-dependent DNA ligase [Planctomycetota bacterium]
MTLLATVVETSRRVGETSARLAKVRALAGCLRELSPDEVEIGAHYLSGETPQGRSGIGYAALAAARGQPAATSATLSLAETDRDLQRLAELRGAGVAARRAEGLAQLFSRATEAEQDFLVRLLAGELRQGALAGVMLDAITAAAELPAAEVRRAAMYAPDLGAVAAAALQEGSAGLARFQLQVLSPVAPMLAQTAADTGEALQQWADGSAPVEVAFEWKIDGARIQAHRQDDLVRIYTRSLNDVSAAVPEIVEAVRRLPARDLVLDGEAVALKASGRPHPFQVTMRRFSRKLDVEALRAELPMAAFFFDCLRLEGESLAERPARERFAALARVVPDELRMPQLITSSDLQAQAFQAAALAAGHEGVMAKSLDAPYEAGSRGSSWLKIKRAHTLDLVVLGAEWGHGRRSGKLSNLHLGALDPATGQHVMLGKTFKGLTDAMLEWQTQAFLARETHREGITVFIRPELVVEVAFSDLQVSPRYPGGLALRLARVKRYREDKRPDEADTMDAVRRLAASQI